MDEELRRRIEESGYARPGFAERYERFRPSPPPALLNLLPPLAGVERPALVVDLGAGTGLSTRIWADRANEVIGVEPNDAMRRVAEQATTAGNVGYLARSAYDTGLPVGCADLVTAAQSLQWMDPKAVFPEIGRILREGGVFCAYQYSTMQTPLWEPEQAWQMVRDRMRDLRTRRGPEAARWPVSTERLEQSGVFRAVREMPLHSIEYGDGERLLGFALSEGSLANLLDEGTPEDEIGLDRLRETVAEMPEPVPWWVGYQAWVCLR